MYAPAAQTSQCNNARLISEFKVTVRFSEGPFFRRFIVPKVHCSEGSLFRKKGLLCRRFIGPKGHLSEMGVHCSEGLLFRRFIVPK